MMCYQRAHWAVLAAVIVFGNLFGYGADTTTAKQSPSLNVLFTGRLLGYFRNPPLQSGMPNPLDIPCPRVSEAPQLSVEGTKLFHAVQSYKYEARVFVGTGDNFAVYLPSRILEPSSQRHGHYAKDQFDWYPNGFEWARPDPPALIADLRKGLGIVPTDNVGCYLAYAGYDAIVPGKEDFYFGPSRLQALARFLASIPRTEDSPYQPVQMLAANLLIKTSWLRDHDPIPDSKKPLLPFKISDSSKNPQITFPADGTEILPWLAEVTGSLDSGATREIVISGPVEDPDRQDWTMSVAASAVRVDFPNSPQCWAVRNVPGYSIDPKCETLNQVFRGTPEISHWRLERLKPMAPGNYKACIWPLTGNAIVPVPGARPTCSRFRVGTPLFQYTNLQLPAAGPNTNFRQHDPSPYLIKRVCDQWVGSECQGERKTVAVFGVVDPAMEEKIGKLESVWRAIAGGKEAKKYETSLEVIDPAQALTQLIDYVRNCGERGDVAAGDVCYGAADEPAGQNFKFTKILLAQMDAGKATLLAAHFIRQYRFETVISEYDAQQFTRNQISLLDPSLNVLPGLPNSDSSSSMMDRDRKDFDLPAFVAVPPRAWDPTWSDDPVRVLRISYLNHGQRQYVVSGSTAKRSPNSPAICDDCIAKAAQDELSRSRRDLAPEAKLSDASVHTLLVSLTSVLPVAAPPPPHPSEKDVAKALADATLYAMLQQTHADVALMQKHDFYLPNPLVECLVTQVPTSPSATPCPEVQSSSAPDVHAWQKILDALIWKGDIVTVIPVRGSVLQAVMKRSHQYDLNDQSGLSLNKEADRGLRTLGIKADGFKDSYLINDLPLDPNRLYSVATTDYIALGDTGYPDLIDASVPEFPRPIYDKRPFQYVSSLVCRDLVQKLPASNGMECTPDFTAAEYFDELDVEHPLPATGNTWQERWKSWLLFLRHVGQDEPGVPKGRSIEDWAQEQPSAWRFSLDKTSIGFTLQRHSDSQAVLNRTFGGVSNAQATAAKAHSWNTDQEASYTYNHHAWDFVSTEALLYTASFVDAKSGAYRNPNQSVDSFTVNVGPRFHLPNKRKLPHWGIGTYLHYDTQPFAVEQSLSLTKSQIDVPGPLQFFLPRIHTLTDRVGVGNYGQKSYFEFGLEGGRAFNAFDQFKFFTNGSLVLTCSPSASQSLQKCISLNGDTIVTPSSRVQVTQNSRPRTGTYWHSLLTFPTGDRMALSLEDQGEFYFNNSGDNSTDTRVQNLTTAKYSFQIWPSLSFAPTYQIFLYENKQAYKSLWQQQAMIMLDFKFDWTSRRIGRSQVRYKAPSPK